MIRLKREFIVAVIVLVLVFLYVKWNRDSTYHSSRTLANSPTPAPIRATPTRLPGEVFEATEKWLYFNKDFHTSKKRFRLKYPPIFDVEDSDSGSLQLYREKQLFLVLDETFPLTEFPLEETQDKQFKAQYCAKRDILYNRIDLGGNDFVYKVFEVDEDLLPIISPSAPTIWHRYIGVKNERGFELLDLYRLPEDVILQMIHSIEFK